MRYAKRFWWLIPLFIILAVSGFVIWALTGPKAMPEAIDALQSDSQVLVDTSRWLAFFPAEGQAEVGFIIYPGGRVDPRAYAPAARQMASNGFLVVIVPMPLNLAVLSPNKAADVIEAYPFIESWAIGGHSLGGSMAANFVDSNPESVDGIALWAAYPPTGDNLSDLELWALSIYGTNDGVTTLADIDSSRPLLPEETVWQAIEGGNHAQFGYYGDQPGDSPAVISREEQQQIIVREMLAFLEQLSRTDR